MDALPDYYPDFTAETKGEDYGVVDGNVVALDYGLPFADAVLERRTYYQGFGGAAAAEVSDDA